MLATVIVGFHLAALFTGLLGVYYVGIPFLNYLSHLNWTMNQIDIALFTIYGLAIMGLAWHIDTWTEHHDHAMKVIETLLATKDARIQQLEFELKKYQLEEGNGNGN
jgi:hypothetical protein